MTVCAKLRLKQWLPESPGLFPNLVFFCGSEMPVSAARDHFNTPYYSSSNISFVNSTGILFLSLSGFFSGTYT